MARKIAQKKTDWSTFFIVTGMVLLLIVLVIGFKKAAWKAPELSTSQVYSGTLPCADCSGLHETITLLPSETNRRTGTYIMHDVYEGKNMKPMVTQGSWVITKGTPFDPQAQVVTLDPEEPAMSTYFLFDDGKSLTLLDNDKEKIDSPFDETLSRVSKQKNKTMMQSKTNLANPASVNCKEQGGTLVMQQRGDGGTYGLCQFEDNQACEEWALYRGECPVGGVKTTGFDTIEQQYCAWLGGQTLAVPDATCTLPNGNVCSDEALYNGTCS